MALKRKKLAKWILGTLAVILLLITAFILLLHTQKGKQIVAGQIESYLAKKLQTEVSIDGINYRLPDWIEIRGLQLKDKNNDVLLTGKTLRVDINMLKLLRSDIEIDQIALTGINMNVYRNYADSNFSYQFLIDAFTSKTTDTASEKKELRISLDRVNMDDVTFRYKDAKDGKYYSAIIGTFRASMDELDLTNNHFVLKNWWVKNTRVTIIDSSSGSVNKTQEAESGAAPKLRIEGASIGLRQVAFSYHKVYEKTNFESTIDTFRVLQPAFDLSAQSFSCVSTTLQNSSFAMVLGLDSKNKSDSSAEIEKPWNIHCDTLSLSGNSFKYDNNFHKPPAKGIDFNHLVVKDIFLNAENIEYVNNALSTKLKSSSFYFNDVLALKNAAASITYSDSLIGLKDVLVAFNNSKVIAKGNLAIPINNHSKKTMPEETIRVQMDSSYVSFKDIELLAPGTLEKLPVNTTKEDRVNFAGYIAGSTENLSFRNLKFYTASRQFVFQGSGNVSSINDKNLRYAVSIQQLHADKRLLKSSTMQQLQADSIQIPPEINITGSISGSSNSVTATNLTVKSAYGTAKLNGNVKNFSDKANISYKLNLRADQLETGKWISKDSLLGKLTGTVRVAGKGATKERLIADIDVAIGSLRIKRYSYSAIRLKSNYNQGAFKAAGSINDPNIVSDFDVSGNAEQGRESANGYINVSKADLYSLQLAKDSFNVSTNIVIDASSLQPEDLKASILIDSSTLFVTGKKIYIDSIRIDGESRSDSTFISMASPFLLATLNGKYRYDQLPKQVNNFVQTNYLNKKDTITEIQQQALFTATVTSHDFVTYMNPDLTLEKPIIFTASFDNAAPDTTISALLKAAAVRYKTTGVEEIEVKIAGKDTALQFNIAADRLVNAEQTYLKPSIIGSFNNKTWTVAATTKDGDDKDFYGVKAAILVEDDKTTIKLTDDLLLNADVWKVAENNSISILDNGFVFENLSISRGGQSLSLSNSTAGTVSPIELRVDSFELASITAFFNKDSLIAAGKLEGQLTIEQPIRGIPEAKGELAVQGLKVKNIPIGNAQISSSVSNNRLEFDGSVTGENQVTLKGNAGIDSKAIEAELLLQKLDMKSVEAFSGGKIIRASGNITGHANLSGTIDEPRWKGELNFDNAAFALTDFNSVYRIQQEKIVFDYPNITLDQFELRDTANNPLTIDGNLKSLDNGTFDIDLSVRARNFIAINAPKKSERIIYGTGIMDLNVVIEGNSNQPSIQGNATLDKGSNIYYMIPQKNNYAEERNEIVTFIKADTIKNIGSRKAVLSKDSVISTGFIGLAYNLNLEVNKEATLTIVIDPLTNDELQIQGTAQINAGIGENGEIGLSGVYNLESGYYNMNYQLIKRKFALVKGSTLTFSGDPKNAIADITAQYETNASASDLLANEISSSSPSIGAGFTEKIPFVVILTIKGSLLKPQLGFDIKLKEGAAGVSATVADAIENKLEQIRYDVSAMNKQVFGLLIMNRFIGEKSSDFFGGGGFHADAVARESVSRFLTEAVNQIADELIKGVDIDINLKNYEAIDNTINRTDLDVALSKRILNDRLTITIGKNFTVEGSDPVAKTRQSANTQYIPDITTTYKLSKNGRYMLRGYRKNQYEAQVDGYFIETGMVFSVTMDYNRFRELLQKRKRRNPDRVRNQETNIRKRKQQ